MFNMQKVLKQVQKMQEDMARVQEELSRERVEGTAGGGVVRAVASGQGELVAITIDPKVVDPQDVSMLEDLVVAAAKEALRKARDLSAERMKDV
jgi:DNA-binding YbaB/EbfC family protein